MKGNKNMRQIYMERLKYAIYGPLQTNKKKFADF